MDMTKMKVWPLLSAHIATSQAEVRKITLHEMHMARLKGRTEGV